MTGLLGWEKMWQYSRPDTGYIIRTCQTNGQTDGHWPTAKTALTHSVKLELLGDREHPRR